MSIETKVRNLNKIMYSMMTLKILVKIGLYFVPLIHKGTLFVFCLFILKFKLLSCACMSNLYDYKALYIISFLLMILQEDRIRYPEIRKCHVIKNCFLYI